LARTSFLDGVKVSGYVTQALATYSAVAVQNIWNTVLDTTKNCRILGFAVEMETAGETVEGRITIDGQTWTFTAFAAAADTPYWGVVSIDPDTGVMGCYFSATNYLVYGAMACGLEGRSVKVEVRKTTANGANNLKSSVIYQKIP
jgi:hypothetical protein